LIKVVPQEAALLFSSEGSTTILISDLHLGLEKEIAAKGFRIPPYSMKMLERIKGLAERYHADRIVILGDVKHSIAKVQDIDLSVLPWFFDTLLDLFSSVEVVPGNHDGGIRPLLPPRVVLHPSHGAIIGGDEKIGVAHGHAWPSEEVIATKKLVIGHSHFTYELRDRFGAKSRERVWLFARYRVEELFGSAGYKGRMRGEGKLIVMPPFNLLVGGQAINTGKSLGFGPVLSSGKISLAESDVFLLDGTRVT
jgi:putative SbcD/Mre11-related phosphoesterase